MKEECIREGFCVIGDDEYRIELGPQYVELDCTDENLSNYNTPARYRMGAFDADGNFIRADEVIAKEKDKVKALAMQTFVDNEINTYGRKLIKKGDKMKIVDSDCKYSEKVWYVYKMEIVEIVDSEGNPVKDSDGNVQMNTTSTQLKTYTSKEKALKYVRGLK